MDTSKVEQSRPKKKKTGGRKKGTPNRTTQIAKDAIAEVAENLGGVKRLTAWVRESEDNERTFWAAIYPKLLPLQVNADVGLTVRLPKGSEKL